MLCCARLRLCAFGDSRNCLKSGLGSSGTAPSADVADAKQMKSCSFEWKRFFQLIAPPPDETLALKSWAMRAFVSALRVAAAAYSVAASAFWTASFSYCRLKVGSMSIGLVTPVLGRTFAFSIHTDSIPAMTLMKSALTDSIGMRSSFVRTGQGRVVVCLLRSQRCWRLGKQKVQKRLCPAGEKFVE